MIGQTVEKILLENQESFLVPAENVATVLYNHPLNHALLVLSKVGYSKIPVLDSEDHLVGLISLSNVVERMMDLTGFSMDNLEGLTAADVMEVNVACINSPKPPPHNRELRTAPYSSRTRSSRHHPPGVP